MATNRFLGRAKARANVATVQVTAYDAATTYSLTVNGKSVTTIAAGSVNATATALAAAWNAATEAEFAEQTASANTDTVTLTADTEGVPHTVTSSVSGGAGTIGAVTTTTAATGPTFWDNVNNWSLGTIPVDTEDVIIDLDGAEILDGLGQSAVNPATFIISGRNITIGRPKVNPLGYTEYRSDYLAIGPVICRIGIGEGPGSGRIKLDFGTDNVTLEVRKTSTPAEDGTMAVQIKGGGATTAIDVGPNAYVGIALHPEETAAATTLTVSPGATVVCGAGFSPATVETAGALTLRKNTSTALTVTGGATTLEGDGTHASIDIKGGVVNYNSSGTATAVTVGPGLVDCSGDASDRTFTTTTLRAGGSINDPQRTITHTNKLAIDATVTQVTAA
jgi:hypothetical protein